MNTIQIVTWVLIAAAFVINVFTLRKGRQTMRTIRQTEEILARLREPK